MSVTPSSASVVVLIANAQAPVLTNDVAGRIRLALVDTDFGFGGVSRKTLSAGIAEEMCLNVAATPDLRSDIVAACRGALGDLPVDIAVLPAAGRRKKLLIADMDSTIIGQECLDELADFAGLKAEIATVTERAMRGELAFEDALRARVSRLAGLSADALERTFRERITLNPGASTLTATMRAHGATTILASGGFTFFTERVAAIAGFDRQVANVLGVTDGAVDGTVREPIFGREGKAETLRAACRDLAIATDAAMAVGDGANDLGMIAAAGLGVAFRAKPAVAAAAGVGILHGDLTALLFLQGYTDAEFA